MRTGESTPRVLLGEYSTAGGDAALLRSDGGQLEREYAGAMADAAGVPTRGLAAVALSLGVVDENINTGDILTLVWGEPDGGTAKTTVERHKQTEIRVKVSPVPYSKDARENYVESWRTRSA